MKLSIHTGGGLPFVRKEPYEWDGTKYEADIQTGDKVKILDSGAMETSQYGEQTMFRIKTRNGDKKAPFNQKSINVLIQEFGDETESWIGKEVKVILHKGMFGGKKGIAAYFVTDNWQLDEYGELFSMNSGVGSAAPQTPTQTEGEVRLEDIPF